MDVASTNRGNAMGMLIARMAVTKTLPFVVRIFPFQFFLSTIIKRYDLITDVHIFTQIIVSAIQAQNLLAKMAGAFRKYGCVTLTMIVAMTVTNQRICVVKETVQLVGSGVQATPIIVAFLNGCSAMERMIVATVPMNCPITVPNAIPRWTSSARIIDAYPNNGSVILRMTVVMAVTKLKLCARTAIENVLNQSSVVTMVNVLPLDGGATVKTTVVITAMKMDARRLSARYTWYLFKFIFVKNND